jgi:protein-S-isoprenylcysteine O-methyltransferase Ste14/membrane protease YdiL (CAAX protease family)
LERTRETSLIDNPAERHIVKSMDFLPLVESLLRYLGGAAALAVLALLIAGLIAGLRRPTGQTTGRMVGWLHHPALYVFASLLYFGLMVLLWHPIWHLPSPTARIVLLALGAPLFFLGLGLITWGRLALGSQYFVSTAFGAQLFTGHRLVTTGPYAIVRHPIYVGMVITGLGGLLLYGTWTWVFFTVTSISLFVRARREEKMLAAAFGEEWQSYCKKVHAWLLFWTWKERFLALHPGAQAIFWVLVLFLPSIPAYLWIWPNLNDTGLLIANTFVGVYVLAGTLLIGLRCWNPAQLGINQNGIWLSLFCGFGLVAGRSLVILSVDWGQPLPHFSYLRLSAEFWMDFILVGITQELLFRGLIYRALEDWLGVRWAIWGSSICFMLWHVFGGGPLIGIATFLYGLVFALIRWRAGGILGAIVTHGAIDFFAVLLMPTLDVTSLVGKDIFTHPTWMAAGLVLILFVPLYLWLLYPRFHKARE